LQINKKKDVMVLLKCRYAVDVSPVVLMVLYHTKHYVKCGSCREMVSGAGYKDECGCRYCQENDDDDMCVELPGFSKKIVRCKKCGVELNFFCNIYKKFINPEICNGCKSKRI